MSRKFAMRGAIKVIENITHNAVNPAGLSKSGVPGTTYKKSKTQK